MARNELIAFDAWMARVDSSIIRICGLTHYDLADQTWRDWFNDGLGPGEAAEMALEDEGFPFEGE